MPRPWGNGVPDKILLSAGLDLLSLEGLTSSDLPSLVKREKKSSFADLAIGDRSISLFRPEKKYFSKENHTDVTEILCLEEKTQVVLHPE